MSDQLSPLTHSESIRIDASPATVWSLVTSMDRYGEWSSENTGGYWRKNADGVPGTGEIGDKFVGRNSRDGVEWKALVEVVERDEPNAFAFVTGGMEYNVAMWRYALQPDGDGTMLTEQWELRNREFFIEKGGQAELDLRVANSKESIAATLKGMKAAAEAS